MAQLPNPFNAHNVEPAVASPQLPISGPEGLPVVITASEFKPSKSNAETGQNNGYLELTLTVIDGPHKGETGPYRLNLYHNNPQTVDIANRQLSALCHVTNQMMISDSGQLHNIPFRALVTLQKKAKPEDPDYTQVSGVLDFAGNKPGQAKPAGAPMGQPMAQATPTPAPAAWGAPAQPQQQAFVPGAPGPAATGVKPPWAQ